MVYYSAPIEMFMRLLFRLMATTIGCVIAVPLLLFVGGTMVAMTFAFPPFGIVFVAWPVMARAGRMGEFRADTFARSLGYGPELTALLIRWMEEDGDTRSTLRERIQASHPPLYERIQRLALPKAQ